MNQRSLASRFRRQGAAGSRATAQALACPGSRRDVTDNSAGSRTVLVFVYVTLLFFTWGFVTNTIDPLVASVREVFQLSFAQATRTQLAFFAAYGVVSLPAAAVVARR